MPVLKKPRYERIAQLLASGKAAMDAYEQAGYKLRKLGAGYRQ